MHLVNGYGKTVKNKCVKQFYQVFVFHTPVLPLYIAYVSVTLIGSLICLFDLLLYVPSTIFQLNRDGSSWAEPVLS